MQKQIVILTPANTGLRFTEDGLDIEAKNRDIFFSYKSYYKRSQHAAIQYANKLTSIEEVVCVVYPELHSEIFIPETRCRAWGVSHRNGELQETTNEEEVSGLKFIQILKGKLPVIPMPMHHSSQFDADFDIGFHGSAKDFVDLILNKLQRYGTCNAKGA